MMQLSLRDATKFYFILFFKWGELSAALQTLSVVFEFDFTSQRLNKLHSL